MTGYRTASFFLLVLAVCQSLVAGSVFLPHDVGTRLRSHPSNAMMGVSRRDFSYGPRKRLVATTRRSAAMAIPGYGVTEQIFVGGFANFLSLYNVIITVRVLLSWFPQAQGIGALQPVFAITDPFLNLFRGVIPPIGGFDLSPLAAFFLLNVLTNATAAVGAEIPRNIRKKIERSPFGKAVTRGEIAIQH